MQYNWQQKDWPNFSYDPSVFEGLLLRFTEEQGKMKGLLEAMPEEVQKESIIDIMVSEAVKTSAIEGENLSRSDVRSQNS